MNSMCCLVNGEGVGWWTIIPLESILSREEYYGFSLSYFRLLIGLTLPHFAVVQATFFLFFFFSCRDISFLYDAGASGRKGLDSAGKPLITPGSEKSQGSVGSKQLETLMKSKHDDNQEAMVHSLVKLIMHGKKKLVCTGK